MLIDLNSFKGIKESSCYQCWPCSTHHLLDILFCYIFKETVNIMQMTLCFWLFKNSQLWTCFPALLQLEHVEEITSSLRILCSAVHDKFQTLDWTYTICFWTVQLRHWLCMCSSKVWKKWSGLFLILIIILNADQIAFILLIMFQISLERS